MNTQEQMVPYSVEAEQAVLGGLVLDNAKWDDINPILSEQNFYLGLHKEIFKIIREMLNKNQSVDVLTLDRAAREANLLEKNGGFAYIAELCKNTPSAANIVAYAHIVKRDSQARALFALGNELRSSALQINSQEKLDTVLGQTEKSLTELTFNQLDDNTTISVNDGLIQVVKNMDASIKHRSLVTGIPFGIDRLDENTTGGQSGDLVILAARPSMGKTALSLRFVTAAMKKIIASRENEPFFNKTVQYFSLEMPAVQIFQRLISMQAKVASQKMRQAIQLTDEETAKIAETLGVMNTQWQDRLLIDESNYLTPQMLKSKVRRNARQYGKPAVIIVDYIQLMSDPAYKDGKNRHLEISSISRELKSLAKEMDCPVIALSQLNRSLEQRANKRPMPSDLRESGSLEQDADLLLFIYRDEVYNDVEPNEQGIAEIMIGKQRNGPIGTIFTRFRGEYSLFENLTDAEYSRFEG
ncbi:replicative DNA helicase [Mannheimia glucosida]|uniref:replicative DNA helicase n=1 Tax=Mannheimia glucosida TaxID=85401 RepID=UPI0039185B3C